MRSRGKNESTAYCHGYCVKEKKESEVPQCLTLCDPMDHGLPGSSVHGILQARVLEWVAISFSKGSSWPRSGTQVSRIASRLYRLNHQGIHISYCMKLFFKLYPAWFVGLFCPHPPEDDFSPWPGDPLPANGPFFPCSRITRRCTTTMTALATASACASG